MQEQHTISQTSVGAMAAEVQQLTWQLSAARRANVGHKDDLVQAGRTVATLMHQLQAGPLCVQGLRSRVEGLGFRV